MTRCIKNILAATLAVALAAGSGLAQAIAGFGNLPLYFEAAPAQRDGAAGFLAHGGDGQVWISPAGAQLTLRDEAAVTMQFQGAGAEAQIHGAAELAGKINYLTGNDPARWRTGVPTFAKVRVENLYPGIAVVYYGNQQQLEYDFEVSPGASPNSIAIRFHGAKKVSINAQGELALSVGQGEIRQPKPVIYQLVAGTRREIQGGYKIVDGQTVAVAVGSYDHRLPLVIDPTLVYSTYFGGASGDSAYAVALNKSDGSVYITGHTFSSQIYTNGVVYSTARAYQPAFHGGSLTGDAFVARFDKHGQTLIYFTYLGGKADDAAFAIAVDGAGNAYVTGVTDSSDFPVVNNVTHYAGVPGLAPSIGGPYVAENGAYADDAFVAEVNPGGSNLVYSAYLGGSGYDFGTAIALDLNGNAYVAGCSYSTNFPVKNAIQAHLGCGYTYYYNANAFVTEIATNGTNLVFSTYLGGTNYDRAQAIAVDNHNCAYVAGFTSSTNFPITNAFQPLLNGALGTVNQTYEFDGFAAKFGAGGTNLLYSTFLGSTNTDEANAIAVDSSGAAYVAGWTTSPTFPVNPASLLGNSVANDNAVNGIITTNAFLSKITQPTAGGAATNVYSVVFGGGTIDLPFGVAVDAAGDAFVTGATASGNFPVVNPAGLLRAVNSGGYDAFVTAFNSNGTGVLYSTYLGGSADDYGYGIAVDSNSTVYVAGQTDSGNFPVTTASTNFPIYAALSPALKGPNNCFLAEILTTQFSPRLAIAALQTNKVTLSWRNYSEPAIGSFSLESTPSLLVTNLATGIKVILTNSVMVTNHVTVTNWIPTTNWMLVTNVAALSNGSNVVTLPSTNKSQFFRLVH